MESDLQKVTDLMVEKIESVFKPSDYDLERDYPEHCTIGVIDLDFGGVGTDMWFEIYYDDNEQMQREIGRVVRKVFTPELLGYFAKGGIVNLTLRLGPDALSGVNFFDELGVQRPKKRV